VQRTLGAPTARGKGGVLDDELSADGLIRGTNLLKNSNVGLERDSHIKQGSAQGFIC